MLGVRAVESYQHELRRESLEEAARHGMRTHTRAAIERAQLARERAAIERGGGLTLLALQKLRLIIVVPAKDAHVLQEPWDRALSFDLHCEPASASKSAGMSLVVL